MFLSHPSVLFKTLTTLHLALSAWNALPMAFHMPDSLCSFQSSHKLTPPYVT